CSMTPQRLRARRSFGSRPKSRTWPEVGFRTPSIRLIDVVLPAPFGPSIATTSPARIVRSIPLSPSTSPNVLPRASISPTFMTPPPVVDPDGVRGKSDERSKTGDEQSAASDQLVSRALRPRHVLRQEDRRWPDEEGIGVDARGRRPVATERRRGVFQELAD